MSAKGEICALCDQPGRELREALDRYSKGNARTPYSIQADSMLYGDLVRHYLQWCAGLLAKMDDAAAARPAWKEAVAQLLERSIAYFKDTARWPSVPHLEYPLRLLVPACYAMRAAGRVNSLTEPALVAVDFTEPNEFAIEILGQPVFEQISHHKNADFETIAKITEDPPHEAEPLHYRSFLHAAQRCRLAEARDAKPKPPQVAPPPLPPTSPVVAAEEDTALAQSWSQKLSDTRITLEQTNSPPGSGYGAGTPYWSRESFLDLYRGHRYRLLEIGFVGGMSYAGFNSPPQETRKESEGEWKIQVRSGAAILVLTCDNGGEDYYRIEKASWDAVKLDGRERAWKAL
ncbi:MAG: hypothetical protein ACJ8LL_09785 [Candidatus Udaeobacter sp.]